MTWVINSKLMLEASRAQTREPEIPWAHPKLNCGYSSFCEIREGESVRLGKEYRVHSKPSETTVILTWLSWWWNTPKSSRQPHEHRENGCFVPKAGLQRDRLWYSLQWGKRWEKTNVKQWVTPSLFPQHCFFSLYKLQGMNHHEPHCCAWQISSTQPAKLNPLSATIKTRVIIRKHIHLIKIRLLKSQALHKVCISP